jgi:hypothetical protein
MKDESESEKVAEAGASSVPTEKTTEIEKLNDEDDQGDRSRLWRMRWFQMVGTLAVILIIPIAAIIAFCVTQQPYCFAPCGLLIAPAWRLSNRITNFLFPQDARDFQLEIAKVLRILRSKSTQQ